LVLRAAQKRANVKQDYYAYLAKCPSRQILDRALGLSPGPYVGRDRAAARVPRKGSSRSINIREHWDL
jgi:hypothetical protein